MLKMILFLALFSLMAYARSPSGLTQLNEKYLISDETATFIGAYLSCKGFGYKMASVSSKEDFIQLSNSIQLGNKYWLGGGYVHSQEFLPKWIWLESGDELTYTNWASTEPSLVSGDNCLEISSNGTWYAQSCANSYYYICEK